MLEMERVGGIESPANVIVLLATAFKFPAASLKVPVPTRMTPSAAPVFVKVAL